MVVGARLGKIVGIAAVVSGIVGCQNVGPIAIDTGRDRYNNVIQSTAMEQTLANIIRVHNNELTNFMDVTEVDTGTSFSGSISGAATNIGAIAGVKSTSAGTISGQVGAINSGVSYTEAPTIRYLPLVGSGLVSQLVSPVSTDALESLYNSSWKAGPLLDLATVYQTFDFDYNAAAENLTAVLSLESWVSLVATKSQLTMAQDQAGGGTQDPGASGNLGTQNQSKSTQVVRLEVQTKSGGGGSGPSDTITIYLRPWDQTFSRPESVGRLYFWVWLLAIYHGTQSAVTPANFPNFKTEDLSFCKSWGLYEEPSPTTSQTTSQTTSLSPASEQDDNKAATKTETTTTDETQTTIKKIVTTAKKEITTTTTIQKSYQLSSAGLERLKSYLLVVAKRSRTNSNDQHTLVEIRKCLPNSIELRTASVQPGRAKGLTSVAPLLKTYSALGILKKGGGHNSPKFGFVEAETYRRIRSYAWNDAKKVPKSFDFYTVMPCDEENDTMSPDHHNEDWNVAEWLLIYDGILSGKYHANDGFDKFLVGYAPVVYWPPTSPQEAKKRDTLAAQSLHESCPQLQKQNTGTSITDFIDGNTRLNELRRYILIVKNDQRPLNPYVAHYDNGVWYYIDGEDTISQKNFELISLFLTVMAVPGTTAPLTPTISVGGTGGGG